MNIKSLLIGSAAALALVCSAAYAASPGGSGGSPADIVYGATSDPSPGEKLAIKVTIVGPQVAVFPQGGLIIERDETLTITAGGEQVILVTGIEDTVLNRGKNVIGPQVTDAGSLILTPEPSEGAGLALTGDGDTIIASVPVDTTLGKKPNLLGPQHAESWGGIGKDRPGWATKPIILVSLEGDGGMKRPIVVSVDPIKI